MEGQLKLIHPSTACYGEERSHFTSVGNNKQYHVQPYSSHTCHTGRSLLTTIQSVLIPYLQTLLFIPLLSYKQDYLPYIVQWYCNILKMFNPTDIRTSLRQGFQRYAALKFQGKTHLKHQLFYRHICHLLGHQISYYLPLRKSRILTLAVLD